MRIFINGFGRIGRVILRQVLAGQAHHDLQIVGVNDIAGAAMCAYLFQYDSTFGPFDRPVRANAGALCIGDISIPLHHTADLRDLDLSGVDVVLECTGIARSSDVAQRGLQAGARRVLISGPSPAAELTAVLGANDHLLGNQSVVSNASCTTNGLAPLVKLLNDLWGIERGHMTTIHCYTNSQPMVDAPRGDFARSRGGAQSMVPTGSSAIQLIDDVLPELAGRISGAAVRVPSPSVSAIDLIVQLNSDISQENLQDQLVSAIDESPVLGWIDGPLVSSDLRGRPESLVIALPETRLVAGRQLRIYGWYDNEWGFSARMLDMAARMAG